MAFERSPMTGPRNTASDRMVDDGVPLPDSETADQARCLTALGKSADHSTQRRSWDSRSKEYSPNSDAVAFEDRRRTPSSGPKEIPNHPITGAAPPGIVFARGRRTAHLLPCLLMTDFIAGFIYISDLNAYSSNGSEHPLMGMVHSNYCLYRENHTPSVEISKS